MMEPFAEYHGLVKCFSAPFLLHAATLQLMFVVLRVVV
jgi:hypothetical protein